MLKPENLPKLYRTQERLIKLSTLTNNRQQEYFILEEIELLNKIICKIKNGLIKLD